MHSFRVAGSAAGAAARAALFVALAGLALPARALTLDEAIDRALERSPSVASADAEERARAAEIEQAASRSNPEVSLEVENWGGGGAFGGFGSSEATAAVTQRFELGGKRGRRLQLARAEANLAGEASAAARRNVVRDVCIAFAEAAAAEARAAQARAALDNATAATDVARRRHEIGAAPEVEVTRAELETATARAAAAQAAREAAIARSALAGTWGGDASEVDGIEIETLPDENPPTADRLAEAIERSPILLEARAELARREAQRDLESSLARPDLDVFAGARRFEEGGDVAAVAGIAFPLPLFDRRRGATAAANERVESARAALRAAHAATFAQAFALALRLEAALQETRELDATVLPKAHDAARGAQDAYARGLFRFTEVLEARAALLHLETSRIDSIARAAVLHAQLNHLLGEPGSRLTPEGDE